MLYLDHEAEQPSFKERSGRWVGLAQGTGDLLTFWILDDQSNQILARSVVRPFSQNLRVKWDPALVDNSDKNTATHSGDINSNSNVIDISEGPVDLSLEPVLVDIDPDYVNPGLNSSTLAVPKKLLSFLL